MKPKLSVTAITKIASFSLAGLLAVAYAFTSGTGWSQYLLFGFFICYGIFVLVTGWTDHQQRTAGKQKGIFISVIEILFGIVMIAISSIALLLIVFVLE